jgi:hypothetical protein
MPAEDRLIECDGTFGMIGMDLKVNDTVHNIMLSLDKQ